MPAIRVVSEKVVLADWLFTLPATIVQALTGFALAGLMGYRSLTAGWHGRSRCSSWQELAGLRLCGCRFACATSLAHQSEMGVPCQPAIVRSHAYGFGWVCRPSRSTPHALTVLCLVHEA